MARSWFAERMHEGVASLGDEALATFDILMSLPVHMVRNNLAHGLAFAPGRGRDLWTHQAEAMEALRIHLLDRSKDPNGIVVMPTGGGKTEVFVRAVEASGLDVGERRLAVPTIVLAPTRQLVSQTHEVFLKRFPRLHVSAMDTGDAQPGSVTLMTYDLFMDLAQSGQILPGDVAAIVMDEAHRGLSDTRQAVFRRFIGNAVFTAFSASPAFDVLKNVHALLGRENEVINVPDERLRREGIIAPVVNYVLRVNLVGQVPSEPGMRRAIVREASARAILEFVSTHHEEISKTPLRDKRYFGYTNGIARAGEMARALTAIGIPSDSVSGVEPLPSIQGKLDRLARGEIRGLVNDQVLVEGTDLPQARGVIAVDPTVSLVKHLQRCGRARRIDPALDPFDPRQTSSVVEVMVEVNGIPLRNQRIYAESIGDLSIATVYRATHQNMHSLVAQVQAKGNATAGHRTGSEGEPATGGVPDRRRRGTRANGGFHVVQDVRDIHYLLARRERAGRPDEFLPRSMASHSLHVSVTHPGLNGIFETLESSLRAGEPGILDGDPVRAELYVMGTQVVTCIHVDELPRLRAALGLPETHETPTDGWVSKSGLARMLRLDSNDPTLAESLDLASSGSLALPAAPDGGGALRAMFLRPRWVTHVHVCALGAFEAHLGRTATHSIPAKTDNHLSVTEVAQALGTSTRRGSFARMWERMTVLYREQGEVRVDGHLIGFRLMRYPSGALHQCLDRAHLNWLRDLLDLRTYPPKDDGWLNMQEASRMLGVSPYQNKGFLEAWKDLARCVEYGRQPRTLDRDWAFEPRQTGHKFAPCIKATEIDAMRDLLGLNARDEARKTDDWLTLAQVAKIVGIRQTRSRLRDAWTLFEEQVRGGEPAELRDISFRFEIRYMGGTARPCLHRDEVARLNALMIEMKQLKLQVESPTMAFRP